MLAQLRELDDGEWPRLRRAHPEIEPNLTGTLRRELKKPRTFSGQIASEDAFLNLRLLDQSESCLLTPSGESHQLSSVIDRMRTSGWDLGRLRSAIPGVPACNHNPEWFKRCHVSDFDPDKTHWIALTPCKQNDTSFGGPFSIFEGQHRALSYAWFLKTGRVTFSPRCVFILLPRRWDFTAPRGS
jgi:hypothetical protein